MTDRLPPQNLEAEQGVIGSMILDPTSINDVADVIQPEDLYRDAHQIIARVVLDLWADGKAVDALTVHDEFQRRGQLKQAGGEEYIAECVMSVPHSANARYYAQIVRQKAVARHLVETANEMLKDIYSNNFTAEQLLERAETAIMAVGDTSSMSAGASLHEAVSASLHSFEGRRRGELQGIRTGFFDLDDTLHGLQPGKLYILAARPSIGKTALALNIASNVACDMAQPVMFVSLEMTREELAGRFLAARGNVDGTKFQRAVGTSDEERARLYSVAETVSSQSKLRLEDPPAINLAALGAIARRHKARHGLALLVVDYLQLIDGQRVKGEIREQEVSRISRRLKAMSKELHAPVLALCQLNRAAESRDDRKPRLSDLRESGAIEQDADVVMLLHRPDFYDPDDSPGEARVIVPKNRGGETGTVILSFAKQYQRFMDRSPDFGPPPRSS